MRNNLKGLCRYDLMKYLLCNQDDINVDDALFLLDEGEIMSNLSRELNETKSLIDDYPVKWNTVKKMIHDHEYIYTCPNKNKNVSKILPVSRSYFKMCEMYREYNLLSSGKKVACLAEAPGGFVESLLHLMKDDVKIYGISLASSDKHVPKWNRIIKTNPHVRILQGSSGNGDLYDFQNIISLIHKIGRGTMDLVTGDGGFDYSSDYSKQEEHSVKLIYSEIFLALNVQKKGGDFLCKIFDVFKKETIMLLHILKESYEEVYIHKPKVSRRSNSEKYVVCCRYKGYNTNAINLLCHHFHDGKLSEPIGRNFLLSLMDFNDQYCRDQINHIITGIDMINSEGVPRGPTINQIEAATKWCTQYNITMNRKCIYL